MDIQGVKKQLEDLYGVISIDKTADSDEAKEFQKQFLGIIEKALDETTEENVSQAMAMAAVYTKAQHNMALAKDIAAVDKTFAASQMQKVTGSVIKEGIDALKEDQQPTVSQQQVGQPAMPQPSQSPVQPSTQQQTDEATQIQEIQDQLAKPK